MKRNICHIVNFCLILFGITGFPTLLHAGEEVQVRASAPASVSVGQQFRLTFTSNSRLSELKLPSMNAFTVLGGPSTSSQSSYQIINGKATSSNSFSYTYYLQANKEGDWEIPSITVKAGGKSCKTNPVSIHVTKENSSQGGAGYGGGGSSGSGGGSYGNSGSSNSGGSSGSGSLNKNDFFVKAELSKSNPYVEEEVVLHYKLYIGPEANRYQANISKLPSFTSFWTYELQDRTVEKRPYKENLNGKTYTVVDLYDVAIYPQKSGKLTISPLEVEMIVQIVVRQAQSDDPWANFFNNSFFGGNVQNVELKIESKPLSLNVKELPKANRPEDFSGLVGNFSMKSELSRSELKSNDATNFAITISGKGNIQHLEAPQITFPSDIDTHEPGISDKIQKDRRGGISGSRKFDYILIPREAGEFEIPQAQFSYFDPSKKQYITIHSNPYNIKVAKGEANSSNAMVSNNKKNVKELGKDIRFIRTDNPHLKLADRKLFFLSPLYFILLALPLLLFVLFVILLRKKIKDQRNVLLVKDKRASKVARKRLKRAAQFMKLNDDVHFYEEISQVLWGYVGDKFHLPKGELSLDTARQKLEERNMPTERIEEFLETLNQCEYARFAPSSDMALEKMYDKTFAFITNIEAELGKSGKR